MHSGHMVDMWTNVHFVIIGFHWQCVIIRYCLSLKRANDRAATSINRTACSDPVQQHNSGCDKEPRQKCVTSARKHSREEVFAFSMLWEF